MSNTTSPSMPEMLTLARESNPDLWARVEGVAKIIDPAAFATDHVIWPEENARAFKLRQDYMRAVAMNKAHEALRYLGINTDTDWLYILERIGDPDKRTTVEARA